MCLQCLLHDQCLDIPSGVILAFPVSKPSAVRSNIWSIVWSTTEMDAIVAQSVSCSWWRSHSRNIEFCSVDFAGTNEAAAALLVLADESGLTKLRAVCLDYIVHHYAAVASTEAFKNLNSHQRDLIAAESCALYAHLRSLLREVAARKALPET